MKNQERLFEDFETIFTYTRAQAIADGVLVTHPVEQLRVEYKISYPCAMTCDLLSEIVAALGDENKTALEWAIWDMLTMFRHAAKNSIYAHEIFFEFAVGEKLIALKAHCGPGDNLEPVLTFMLPHED